MEVYANYGLGTIRNSNDQPVALPPLQCRWIDRNEVLNPAYKELSMPAMVNTEIQLSEIILSNHLLMHKREVSYELECFAHFSLMHANNS